MGRKEARATTCLDTCRMLSISSTGNVVCLNGRGERGGGRGRHVHSGVTHTSEDFVNGKEAARLPTIHLTVGASCVESALIVESRNMRLFARMPALTH